MTLLSNQQGRELLAKKKTKRSREGNKLTEYNGNTYRSLKEARYAMSLDFWVSQGVIKSWERQKALKCEIQDYHITTYIVDFIVYYASGRIEYVDVKGRKSGGPYQMFQIKKRLVKALLGIDIIEV